MGKKRNGGKNLRKRDIEPLVTNFFESNPTDTFDLKTLYRELGLKSHPEKMLLMDILDTLVMDDFIKEQPRFCFSLNAPTQVMEGTFHRKANGKNTFEPDDAGEPVLVAERNSLHAMDGDLSLIHISEPTRPY